MKYLYQFFNDFFHNKDKNLTEKDEENIISPLLSEEISSSGYTSLNSIQFLDLRPTYTSVALNNLELEDEDDFNSSNEELL